MVTLQLAVGGDGLSQAFKRLYCEACLLNLGYVPLRQMTGPRIGDGSWGRTECDSDSRLGGRPTNLKQRPINLKNK